MTCKQPRSLSDLASAPENPTTTEAFYQRAESAGTRTQHRQQQEEPGSSSKRQKTSNRAEEAGASSASGGRARSTKSLVGRESRWRRRQPRAAAGRAPCKASGRLGGCRCVARLQEQGIAASSERSPEGSAQALGAKMLDGLPASPKRPGDRMGTTFKLPMVPPFPAPWTGGKRPEVGQPFLEACLGHHPSPRCCPPRSRNASPR